MNSKYDEPIVWSKDVAPAQSQGKEDTTFTIIVRQLGGGAWAESVAREILNEGSMDGKEEL